MYRILAPALIRLAFKCFNLSDFSTITLVAVYTRELLLSYIGSYVRNNRPNKILFTPRNIRLPTTLVQTWWNTFGFLRQYDVAHFLKSKWSTEVQLMHSTHFICLQTPIAHRPTDGRRKQYWRPNIITLMTMMMMMMTTTTVVLDQCQCSKGWTCRQ